MAPWMNFEKSPRPASVLHVYLTYMKRNGKPRAFWWCPVDIAGKHPELGKNGRFGCYTGGAPPKRAWFSVSLQDPQDAMQN